MNRATACVGIGVCVSILSAHAAPKGTLKNSRQCLVVTADSWSATNGTMSILERDVNSPWRQSGSTIPVVIGRAGLGWGRGLVEVPKVGGSIKREGDDKAPAGIFRLGPVFGLRRDIKMPMPFTEVMFHTICVDDPDSPYYNRVFNELDVFSRNWRHAERLFDVNVYRMGIIVEHNIPPEAGAGSCIFVHIWESPRTATSGCTAMSKEELRKIIRWLDPAKHPVLVQLPRPVYERVRDKWRLPKL